MSTTQAKGTIMERVESITYDTPQGPVMLRKVDGEWIVSELDTGSDAVFVSIRPAMAHISATYGWPLSLVSS